MSEDAARAPGLIGPNAILQLVPILDQFLGRRGRNELLRAAGIFSLPNGNSMIPENDAFRVHKELRRRYRELAPEISKCAGINTANYILANRIPKPALWLLKALPAAPAAKSLSSAISKHAWTFVGSGTFHAATPWMFGIDRNPLVRNETSEECLCHWNAAVFERLYQALVCARYTCVETKCGAQRRGDACTYEISRKPS